MKDRGLCGGERCRRAVLPQLAKPSFVRLMGEPLVEQKRLQRKREKDAAVSPQQLAWKARKSATKTARSKRRGYFGLAKAIAGVE